MSNILLKRTDDPLKIGITGGIGSGKSLVCSIFRVMGIPVFEADQVAKALYDSSEEIRGELIRMFGKRLYSSGGLLNRQMLASIIFNDKDSLGKVNSLVHPFVRKAFEEWYRLQDSHYVLHEAAILFESGFYKLMDANILVTAPAELRIRRVMERDGISREKVLSRMQNQGSEEEYREMADFIIRNDGEDFIISQVLDTDKKIRANGNLW